MTTPIPLHAVRSPNRMIPFPTARGAAEPSTMADLLHLMGANEVPMNADPVPIRRLLSGETLFREGAHAESIHFVRSGTFKVFHTAQDGYEQVLGFVGRAEVLGFDAVCTHSHPSEAVALEDSTVYVLLLRDLFALVERHPAFGRVVQLAVSNALTRQGELADVMAAVAAEVRLARFLMHLSHRMAARGQSPHRFVLRMGRRDIASYLGVAHETVSRSFSALAGWGLVTVDNREVAIVDIDGLRTLSQGTRRQIDEASRASMFHGTPSHHGLERQAS
jgi:CRP/FNR family transcriptional regulator